MAVQDELMLLERVFLRIGSAETDDQLQTALSRFLPPVLLKLSSETDGVRMKVMELLVHINKRLKSRPSVKLPVREMFTQYMDPSVPPFVISFTVLYIKMGFPRLEPELQVEMVPLLVKCLEGKPEPQQNSFLQLLMQALVHLKLPNDSEQKKAFLAMNERPQVVKLLLDYLLDMIILPYNYAAHQKKPTTPAGGAAGFSERPQQGRAVATSSGAAATPESKFVGPPAGLSEATLKRMTSDYQPSAADLEKIKLGILELLGSDIFLEQDILCHLIVGASDTRHSVATAADKILKKITGSQDWNNKTVIARLYDIFRGTVVLKGKTPAVKPEQKRTPANVQLRLKILPYFLKSREAANQLPACMQVIFECLYGAITNQRLQVMAVQFVHHLCLHCADGKFRPIAAVLLSGMVKLIGDSKEEPKLRSLAYVAVGKISRRVPQLVSKDIALLQTFFDAVCKEDTDNKLAVQEALSMMSEAFKDLDKANMKLLESLILENIEKPQPQARSMAVKYASTVFPPDHIPSRYVLLLACGDAKEDIYTEATKSLRTLNKTDDYDHKMENNVAAAESTRLMPAFPDLVNYIQEKAAHRVKTQKKYVIGNNVLAFNPGTYGEILMYLRMCLAYNAGVQPDLESTTAMQAQASALGKYVNQLLEEDKDDKGLISVYIGIIKQLLSAIGGSPAMYCLLEVVAVTRTKLAPQFVKHLDWFRNFMFSSREDMRQFAAELYALVVATAEGTKKHIEVIRQLTNNLTNQAFEGQHGSLLALGYLIGFLLAKRRAKLNSVTVEDMEVDPTRDEKKLNDAMSKAVSQIVGLLEDTQVVMSIGACTALGVIGCSGALPLHIDKPPVSKLTVVDSMITKLQSGKEQAKVREKSALSLGYLCVGEPGFPHRKKVIDGLLEAAGAQQFELHFTIGEGLVCAAQGAASPAARDKWLTSEEDFKPPANVGKDEVGTLLRSLLEKKAQSANPHIRQAACIWLVALVKKCGRHSAVQGRLKEIQSAFISLLAEKDEITQDIASKGLGVVYEQCGEAQKKELVAILVDTFTVGKKKVQQVTGDTEVFEDGAIGKTPEGQQLSTYRELCSIANDLNQPDLIYKFMHLANHNAVWNSKKGAAFGFSSIVAQAGEQLAPYLHQIIPKLYRYQFDPNPKIHQAMASIWSSLVPDSRKTVDKYMKEIVEDLTKYLTSPQWRVRESSCLALNDLLRGRSLDDIVDNLPELWSICFRVRDDIKESVRNAADTSVRALSRASIKICDPAYGKVGERATGLILPTLLKDGLGSQVQEVRAISLSTLVKISKTAGPLLKPNIPLLVTALLEALSTLEPQYLNTISLQVTSSQAAQDRLDSARIAASRMSPMMETINLCLQYVDTTVLAELMPRLNELLRSGLGLGTKAGCAHILISLTHQCPQDIAPYSGKILASLLNGLHDRNSTVRKLYASAIGHVVKVGKDSSVEKLIGRLKQWYMEKEEESIRNACGLALHAISQRSPDVLKRHAALALPLAFLAKHQEIDKNSTESNESDVSVWEEVWLEGTPGTEAGIRIYLTELVQITQSGLMSQSWNMKAQGAAAMATIATKLGAGLQPPYLGIVLKALLAGLIGRTWTGKAALLKAVTAVSVSCKQALSEGADSQPSMPEVIEAMLKESRKEEIVYKTAALGGLADILQAHQLDRFNEYHQITFPMIKNSEKPEDCDKDGWLTFTECAFEGIGKVWPKISQTQEQYQEEVIGLLCQTMTASVWKVELCVLKSLQKVLSRLHILSDVAPAEEKKELIGQLVHQIIPPLCQSLENLKYSAIRTESLGVSEVLVTRLLSVGRLDVFNEEDTEMLSKALLSLTNPELKDKATEIYKIITKTHS